MLNKDFVRRALRFGFSGLWVTALHIVIVVVLAGRLKVDPTVANASAFLVSTLVSYLINTLWSFSSSINSQNSWKFVMVSMVGAALAAMCASIADRFGQTYEMGLVYVVAVVPLLTFSMHNMWTYRK